MSSASLLVAVGRTHRSNSPNAHPKTDIVAYCSASNPTPLPLPSISPMIDNHGTRTTASPPESGSRPNFLGVASLESNPAVLTAVVVVIAALLLINLVLVLRRRALRRRPVPNPPPVNVLAFGGSSSGKTILLASMFHTLALGGREGVQLETDREAMNILQNWGTDMEQRSLNLPPATLLGDMTNFDFAFRVTNPDDGAICRPCRIRYLDYAGELSDFSNIQDHQASPAERFREAYDQCDILMGVLDGARILDLLEDRPDETIEADLTKMFLELLNVERKTIHLVLTKWDKFHGKYELKDVVERLARLDTYRRFVRNPGRGVMRLIPVSSFGLNGFLYDDESGTVRKTDNPQVRWSPYNVAVPLAWSLQDVLMTNWKHTQSDNSSSRFKLRQFSPFFVGACWLLDVIHFHIPLLGSLGLLLWNNAGLDLEFSLAPGGGARFRQLDKEPASLRPSLRSRNQRDLVTVLDYLHTITDDGRSYNLSNE